MAQVIVRNLDDDVVARLKRRAKEHGHALEQELRDILSAAAKPSREELLKEMERLRASTPPGPPIDIEALIREDRDNR